MKRASSMCGPAGFDLSALEQLRIKRLTSDSRDVKRGDTFVAYPGATHDGRLYIARAIAAGAHSVLWEKRGFKWNSAWQVPNYGIGDLRGCAGMIASHVYGKPSARLWTVGVTGTNGKTSCSQWIARVLNMSGTPCAVIGTLGYGMGGRLKPLANTTPEAVWLHGQLAAFERHGARAVAMEASSIGLDQGRLAGVEFDAALFTNLTRDHLDYHGSMQRYRRAKARLFDCASLKHAIINLDDEYGRVLAQQVKRPGLEVIGYGFGPAAARGVTLVRGTNLVVDISGVSFDAVTSKGTARVTSAALGAFNASNLLATIAVALASGMALREAAAAVSRVQPIAGRMQTLGGAQLPLVVVDYAHTPDALEKVLDTLRALIDRGELAASGSASAAQQHQRIRHSALPARTPKLFCVFGCGGDRDRGKRPLMGRLAAQYADGVVVTNDNPRSEPAANIIADIVAGVPAGRGRPAICPDRHSAIDYAIGCAQPGDVVLIAGKGHEAYQEISGVRQRFSDLLEARTALRRWRADARARQAAKPRRGWRAPAGAVA